MEVPELSLVAKRVLVLLGFPLVPIVFIPSSSAALTFGTVTEWSTLSDGPEEIAPVLTAICGSSVSRQSRDGHHNREDHRDPQPRAPRPRGGRGESDKDCDRS